MENEKIKEYKQIKELDKILEPSNKVLKQLKNGFYRIIILWEVNKQPIHGYGLIKKIDEFYQKQIDAGILNKTSSSKIYPILTQMEKDNILEGYWSIKDNKNIKYYKITPLGVEMLKLIHFRFYQLGSNPIWKEFVNDMILTEDLKEFKE